MKKIPGLSVVILCYRSEEHFVPYVKTIRDELEKAGIDFELVLVANYDKHGPPDRTPEIAHRVARDDRRCIVVANPKAGMMGWDLRSGLMAARGATISFVDGDGQTPAGDIVRLYRLMLETGADLCKVYRVKRSDPMFRKITSFLLNFLLQIFFPGWSGRDVNGKPKIMARAAFERMRLQCDDWSADVEIMLEARRLKLKVREIPGVHLGNTWRRSFIGLAAMAEFIKNLIRYRIRYWFLK